MLLNCGVGEDFWESLGLQRDPTSPFWRRLVLGVHWKDWCWCWNSTTLATWCEELSHLKRPWCWERLRARGEGNDRGWDGWMALLTQRTWVCADSGSWWWTGRPGVLWFIGSQSRTWLSDWTELNWEPQDESCLGWLIPATLLRHWCVKQKPILFPQKEVMLFRCQSLEWTNFMMD